ncbi:hypothetical protein [Guptibacillus sedimenti]|uniref:hypothetical protein n=1 Tax=Guptibacillus sedimenti TaxID=3025680 RepID=UPI002361C996|nr:hypothetical protein [Pseudalkalibacillus sedimenti]
MQGRVVKVMVQDKEFTFTDYLDDSSLFKGKDLRTLSQNQWVEESKKHEKIGLIVNNKLELALLSWKRYKELIQAMQTLVEERDQLLEQVEQQELTHNYSDRAEDFERNNTTNVITGKDVDSAFDNLMSEVLRRSKTNRTSRGD